MLSLWRRAVGVRGLDGDDGGDVDDVIGGAASGEVAGGPSQSLQDGAERAGFCEAFGKLVGDVADVEAGEHEDVGAAGDGAAGGLAAGDFRDEGGVDLELAVDEELWGALLGDRCRLADFVNERVAGAAFG